MKEKKESTRVMKNVASFAICGLEPQETRAFETIGGVLSNYEARARVRDGGLIEVKVVTPKVETKESPKLNKEG